jgi:hypothetical protein
MQAVLPDTCSRGEVLVVGFARGKARRVYIFLERLVQINVTLLSQVLRLTQKLVQGQPSLIAVFP